MNCAHTINTNTQPYSNSRRPTVFRDQVQRKGFSRLHSNDRTIYEKLIEFSESEVGTYTPGDLRNYLDQTLNGEMHTSMRVKIEGLLANISRDALNDMLDDYEDLLCRISPTVNPNETKDAYARRTNLPDIVVDYAFNRGDNNPF